LLIIDNCSTDGSVSKIISLINNNFPFKINLIRTKQNVGYSGSQKLAYQLVQNSKNVKKVIMLHSDGQYPSSLLLKFKPYFNSTAAVVTGFRSKDYYKDEEETPFVTYNIVKCLNKIENYFTGFRYKEWHSGFVMYSVNFFKKIPFEKLTSTRHFDGEMLICAGVLKDEVVSIPIYKRYRRHVRFSGFGLVKYVCLHVPTIIIKYIFGYHKNILSGKPSIKSVNISEQYERWTP